MCHFREIEMCHIREMVMRHFREIIFGRLKCAFRNNAFRVFKNYFKNYSNYYNYFFIIHIQIPLAKSRSERGASYHPAFMVSSLTISQTRLLCPPCGKMGLQSWTVLVGINKLWNLKLDRSWQYGGYVLELPLLKPWFATAEMPILFCFTATEMACTNDGGDHEVMYRWRQLTLAEWEGLMMWGRWGWSMWQTVKDGYNFLLMPVCGSVGGGSRTYVWVEWATMGTFCWIPMRGQEKQR